jgi:hypothetical protein
MLRTMPTLAKTYMIKDQLKHNFLETELPQWVVVGEQEHMCM